MPRFSPTFSTAPTKFAILMFADKRNASRLSPNVVFDNCKPIEQQILMLPCRSLLPFADESDTLCRELSNYIDSINDTVNICQSNYSFTLSLFIRCCVDCSIAKKATPILLWDSSGSARTAKQWQRNDVTESQRGPDRFQLCNDTIPG